MRLKCGYKFRGGILCADDGRGIFHPVLAVGIMGCHGDAEMKEEEEERKGWVGGGGRMLRSDGVSVK